jgi:hypothetical protein
MVDPLRERLNQVPVPADGRERVLARLAQEWQVLASEAPVDTPLSTVQSGRSSARWMRRGVLAASVSVVLVAAFATWWTAAPRLDAREIEIAAVSTGLAARREIPEVPYTWEWPRSFNASLLRSARRVLVPVRNSEVVLLSFDLRRGRGRSVPGWLIVVPAHWLKTAPPAGEFLGGEFSYSERHTATWWVEGDYAYACGLGSGDTRLFQACLPQHWAT